MNTKLIFYKVGGVNMKKTYEAPKVLKQEKIEFETTVSGGNGKGKGGGRGKK